LKAEDKPHETPLAATRQQLLVADIGGTNARFARADAISGERLTTRTYATQDFANAGALLAQASADLGGSLAACVIALAGPVTADAGQLTNGTLEFSSRAIEAQLGCPARLLNDFYAVAASIDDSTPVSPIGPHSQLQPGVRAVLGPGTGLGMAYLVPTPPRSAHDPGTPSQWQVLASEGGNADFAPVDALELELLGILQEQFPTVSIETLVSGRGLVNLYRALAQLWGAQAEHGDAAAITAAALERSDPVCDKTLELFCAMLGSAAGNLALTVGAQGGVYLAGGILPRIRDYFFDSEFRRRFEARGALADYNKQIATWLVLDSEPGLSGALREALRLTNTQSRRD